MKDSEQQTRTSYTFGASGYEAVWATGDVLGIYPLGGDQVAFPISDGVGTTRAVFDGGAWALRGTYKYAAYYPFSQDNYTISETEIPVTYIGQIQNSNNATTHLAKYDYMAAAATQPSSDGSVILPFKHLGSYLTLPLTLPKAGTYTKLTLSSSSGSFITKGTVDLSASNPVITATEISSSISMDLNNIVLTEDNLVLTANMLIAPVNLTGSTISITVTDSNGASYTNKEKAWTRSAAFLANTTYKASRTLSGSGTGGEIEGGGGLEEDDDTPNMHNGHEYVDLGLPSGLLWATCNVGATFPEEYGDYYAWGETETKIDYSLKTYLYFRNETDSEADGFNGEVKVWEDLGDISGTKYDVANKKWGSSWRIPTLTEFQELKKNCTWMWGTKNNVNGYKITGTNGNWIFLPAASSRFDTHLGSVGSNGFYWTSTPYQYNLSKAHLQCFTNSTITNSDYIERYYGFSIRPVTK